MIVARPLVQGPLQFKMPVFISVKDVPGAKATVNMLYQRGVDFIKLKMPFRTTFMSRSQRKLDSTISRLSGTFRPPFFPRKRLI